MFCISRRSFLAIVVGVLACSAPAARAGDPNPRAFASDPADSAPGEDARFLFLNGPFDLESILKRLAKPDLVILDGKEYQKLLESRKAAPSGASGPRHAIESFEVAGDADGELAHLRASLAVTLYDEGPEWVPIRLDGPGLRSVREGDRDRGLRVAPDGGWLVELSGKGRHRLLVELVCPIRPNVEGMHLELAIPEVASTRFRIDAGAGVVEARSGPKEPLDIVPIDGGKRVRLESSLTARPRLELSWRVAADPGLAGPPVLSCQGEIAVAIERGSFRTQSLWTVRCERGATRSLGFLPDPADELLELELDDQPLAIEGLVDPATGHVTIPLSDVLRPGGSRRVAIKTRRRVPANNSARIGYPGIPLEGALVQSGVVAVTQGEDLGVTGSPGRGLRQIDPRDDLPANLRARPSTVLAYQFVEQPFDLGLRIDPAPPDVRVESRSTVVVRSGSASIDTTFDYRVVRGRVFEVHVRVPASLQLDGVGPDTVAASTQWLDAPGGGTDEPSRSLVIRLTPRARDAAAFSLNLKARQKIGKSGDFGVALFQPRDAASRGGILALLKAPEVSADVVSEPSPDGRETGGFLPLDQETPAAWTWPADRPPNSLGDTLWFRHEGSPPALALRVAPRSRTVHHETNLTLKVERRRIEYRQETLCQVRNGVLSRLEVEVPASFGDRWEIDGDLVGLRERLGTKADGSSRYRLTFAREVNASDRLRFRVSLPLDPALGPDLRRPIAPAWIRVVGGTASPLRVGVAADAGILLEPAAGWNEGSEDDNGSATASLAPPRLEWVGLEDGPAPPAVQARALAVVSMPDLSISRLWLRSVLEADGSLRTTAWMRVDGSAPTLDIGLPPGTEGFQARVGREPLADVVMLAGKTPRYRLRLPSERTGSLLVSCEYRLPSRRVASPWSPPTFGAGLVGRSYWEVVLPSSMALVGVPSGWSDENQWYWDRYVWKRKPAIAAASLASWVAGTSKPSPIEDLPLGEFRPSGEHSYLFGRGGDLAAMPLWTASRPGLVGIASGLVLAIGILCLVGRAPARALWLAGVAAAFAAVVLLDWSVILLGLQSSLVGLVLIAVSALTQRLVERRRPLAALFHEPSSTGTPGIQPSSSSKNFAPSVGSEESTVVRSRGTTTVDHQPPANIPASASASK